jgi:hypothetical protein|tara:strand:+ start:571 stop:1080 length:510 start_codon:yes stop_codon:yes gene_type:complete
MLTNTNRGTGGANPTGDGSDTPTNGTKRAFSETIVKDVLRQCFEEGGDPDCILAGPAHKQDFSGFTGNATRFKGAEDNTLVASIEIYRSDFGDLQVKPARYLNGVSGTDTTGIREALVIQTDMWALATLRAPHMFDLARDGDSERRVVLAEYALESRNEKASGIAADLS